MYLDNLNIKNISPRSRSHVFCVFCVRGYSRASLDSLVAVRIKHMQSFPALTMKHSSSVIYANLKLLFNYFWVIAGWKK